MNMNSIKSAPNRNRGRIVFWSGMAALFTGLGMLVLLRLEHNTTTMEIAAVPFALTLLCSLACVSVRHPEHLDWKIARRARLNADDRTGIISSKREHWDSEFEATNPATGFTMLGTVDAGGHPHGVDLDTDT